MNRRILTTLIICGTITGGMLEPAMAGRGKCGQKCGRKSGGSPASASVLAEAEARDLLFMREEEKLARDVYLTMHGEYGLRVFSNIPKAEQRHMDAVLGLLNTYGLEDPALDSIGDFANPELQELYDTLVADGLQAKLKALKVGALIEEVDMKDIIEAMARTEKPDLLAVYGRLLAGSKNHLNAFVRNIEVVTGETYVAQRISQKEVDEFLGR